MQIIGVIWGGDMSDVWRFRDAFRQKLHDLGKVEGENIAIEERYIKTSAKPLAALATELAAIPVDVIVAVGTPAAQAATDATKTKAIPVVFAAVGDPELVKAENMTGVRLPEPELSGKRLEVLKEALPKATNVAVLWNEANPVHTVYFQKTYEVAQTLNITLRPLKVQRPQDLEPALETIRKQPPDALIVQPDPMLASQRAKIMSFAVEIRLPAIYSFSRYVEEGGLMSNGPNYPDMFRQVAALVHRILNGTKPSDLPPEEVRCFELVINLNTARRIGRTISDSVLARATVIN
jgi:putative tryptophan/tyrosine transport system substrate-binding protein